MSRHPSLAALLALPLILTGCPESFPFHVLILADRSDSMEDGTGRTCPAIVQLARRAMEDPRVAVGSTLTVWATPVADGVTPVGVFTGAIATFNVMHGTVVGLRKREESMAELAASCPPALTQTFASPLLATLRSAVEALQNEGCKSEGRCALLVSSDLQETADHTVRDAIATTARWRDAHPGQPPPDLPPLPTIDARGIEVSVCGSGHGLVRGAGGDALAQATEDVWRAVLVGGDIRFASVCAVDPV